MQTEEIEAIRENIEHAEEAFNYMCKRWTETKHKVTIDQNAQGTIREALTLYQAIMEEYRAGDLPEDLMVRLHNK